MTSRGASPSVLFEPRADRYNLRRTQEVTDGEVSYGLIPKDDWYQPEWIDEEKATAARNQMVKENVIYGGSVPLVFPARSPYPPLTSLYRYRNMCRFNSGVRVFSQVVTFILIWF